MNNWHILTECYVDTLLVEVVSPPKKGYNHQHCCTKVLRTMKEKFSNNAALGIIDSDKFAPKDLGDFCLIKTHSENISIYQHRDRPHYIIMISKAIEDFILKNAEKCDIELSIFVLPTDLEGLRKITKHIISLKDAETKVKNVFSALKQNKKSDVYRLTQWVENYKTNPYNLNHFF